MAPLQQKVFFLLIGNIMLSVTVGHLIIIKETFKNFAFILDFIHYKIYEWLSFLNLNIVALLHRLKTEYTKFMFFLCKGNNRNRSEWLPRESMMPGFYNWVHESLVKKDKIMLLTLHIKLGLINQFDKLYNKLCF